MKALHTSWPCSQRQHYVTKDGKCGVNLGPIEDKSRFLFDTVIEVQKSPLCAKDRHAAKQKKEKFHLYATNSYLK